MAHHKLCKSNANEFIKEHLDKEEIDLSELNEIDSAGVQAILALHQNGIKVSSISDKAKQVLQTCGCSDVLDHIL